MKSLRRSNQKTKRKTKRNSKKGGTAVWKYYYKFAKN